MEALPFRKVASVGENVGENRRGRPATGCLFRRGDVWWLETRVGGKRVRRSLGTSSRTEAELKRWKLVAGDTSSAAERVTGPAVPLPRAIEPVAVDALAFGALPEVVQNMRARWERIVRAAKARGVSTLKGLPGVARTILLRDLSDLSVKTRREYAGILRRVCRAHQMQDTLAGMKLRGAGATRRGLTDDEVRRLLDAATGEVRLLLLLGLYTGARLGDICRLTWADVGPDAIRITPSKTARSSGVRVAIPIHAALAEALPPRGLPTGPVLPEMWERYRLDRHRPLWWIKEAFRKAGIATQERLDGHARTSSCLGFHALRHTFVSRLASAGVAENIIMAMAGHTHTATSRRYQHLDQGTLAAAVRKM